MNSGANSRPLAPVKLLLGACLALGCDTPTAPTPPLPTVAHLHVVPGALQLSVGASYYLSVDIRDSSGDRLPDSLVSWSSSAPQVAQVDRLGHVVAQSPGITAITASAGGLHSSASLTVAGSAPGTGSIAVLPSTTTVPISGSAAVSAVVRTAEGKVIDGAPVNWSVLDPSIATVNDAGTLLGLSAGVTQVVAAADGLVGSGMVNVIDTAPPPPGPWPNQPSVLNPIIDQPWDHLGGLWNLLWGVARIISDPTAPGSPPGVLQIDFPVGFVGGSAPGTESIDFPATREVYVGIWWMASDPWQGHVSNSNKIEYLFTPENGSMAMIMYGPPSGPYELRVFPDWHGAWLTPNVANVPVTLGRWHRIEWLVVYGPTDDPPSGIVRWWMDGVLLGDYSNVRLSTEPLFEYKLAPVWGGAEPVVKTENDFFRYDHVRIATR